MQSTNVFPSQCEFNNRVKVSLQFLKRWSATLPSCSFENRCRTFSLLIPLYRFYSQNDLDTLDRICYLPSATTAHPCLLTCFITCIQWVPQQIQLWCDTCWALGGQHGGGAVIITSRVFFVSLVTMKPSAGLTMCHPPPPYQSRQRWVRQHWS